MLSPRLTQNQSKFVYIPLGLIVFGILFLVWSLLGQIDKLKEQHKLEIGSILKQQQSAVETGVKEGMQLWAAAVGSTLTNPASFYRGKEVVIVSDTLTNCLFIDCNITITNDVTMINSHIFVN